MITIQNITQQDFFSDWFHNAKQDNLQLLHHYMAEPNRVSETGVIDVFDWYQTPDPNFWRNLELDSPEYTIETLYTFVSTIIQYPDADSAHNIYNDYPELFI